MPGAKSASYGLTIVLLRLSLASVSFLAIWVLFVYQITAPELVAGAVASIITAVSGCIVFRIVPVCFKPRLRWLMQIYRLPAMTATDLWLLLKHLVREILKKPSRSLFGWMPFVTSPDGCQEAGQRALAVLFVSTTPNSVVLDVDMPNKRLFCHHLEPAPVPKLLRKLEE